MDPEKLSRLKASGWTVGNTSDFLQLSPAEAELVELKTKLAIFAKQQRKAQNLSQDSLAQQMGSSQSRIAKIESGDSSVSLDLIFKALFTAGVTRQELAQIIASQ